MGACPKVGDYSGLCFFLLFYKASLCTELSQLRVLAAGNVRWKNETVLHILGQAESLPVSAALLKSSGIWAILGYLSLGTSGIIC